MFVIDQEAHASPSPNSLSRGRPLASLEACGLCERFYSWRAGDRRYVCSVFRSEEEALVGSFSRAIVVGVVREGTNRRPICVMASDDFDSTAQCLTRRDARSLGVEEWHVHFGGGAELLRRFAVALLN
jgi:hypothetical protein